MKFLKIHKVDSSANGNLSFAAAALSTLANPSNYSKIIHFKLKSVIAE